MCWCTPTICTPFTSLPHVRRCRLQRLGRDTGTASLSTGLALLPFSKSLPLKTTPTRNTICALKLAIRPYSLQHVSSQLYDYNALCVFHTTDRKTSWSQLGGHAIFKGLKASPNTFCPAWPAFLRQVKRDQLKTKTREFCFKLLG